MTAFPHTTRNTQDLYQYLLRLGCAVWIPPANGTEWRSFGPVERVGNAQGGVTLAQTGTIPKVLGLNTESIFDGVDSHVDLGTIPSGDPLQLTGDFTMLWLGTPTLTGDAAERLIEHLGDDDGYILYIATTGTRRDFNVYIRNDGTVTNYSTLYDSPKLTATRQLLSVTNDGSSLQLWKNGVEMAGRYTLGSWQNCGEYIGPLYFGDTGDNDGNYVGGMEMVIIHPTRDLTAIEQQTAWALATIGS